MLRQVLLIGLTAMQMTLAKGINMEPNLLKQRIEKVDRSVLKEADSLQNTDLSYLASFSPAQLEGRKLLIEFAEKFKTDWSKEVLLRSIEDSDDGVRYQAAELLRDRVGLEDSKRLLSALAAQSSRSPDELFSLEILFAIGNTLDKNAIEPLMTLQKREKHPEILEAYHMALAKLGFPKETRKIDFSLSHGDGKSKGKALKTIRYIHSPDWVQKVIPLLMDDDIARTFHVGNAHIPVRVHDEAITTLHEIDLQNRIPSYEDYEGPFSDEEVLECRRAYGLIP
jgi:hypothetical protein